MSFVLSTHQLRRERLDLADLIVSEGVTANIALQTISLAQVKQQITYSHMPAPKPAIKLLGPVSLPS